MNKRRYICDCWYCKNVRFPFVFKTRYKLDEAKLKMEMEKDNQKFKRMLDMSGNQYSFIKCLHDGGYYAENKRI